MNTDGPNSPSPAGRQPEFLLNWLREERTEQLEQLWRMADLTRAQFARRTAN